MKFLQITLYFIGFVQAMLGLVFLIIPNQFANSLGLAIPPVWVLWMFGNLGARFLGFSIGMFVAAKNPSKHRDWILIMIFVQVIDWIYVMWHLIQQSVTLAQVATAPFFPVIFVAILGYYVLKNDLEVNSQ